MGDNQVSKSDWSPVVESTDPWCEELVLAYGESVSEELVNPYLINLL